MLVAEDETTLANVQIGRDKVVVSQVEKGIIEFRVRGFAE